MEATRPRGGAGLRPLSFTAWKVSREGEWPDVAARRQPTCGRVESSATDVQIYFSVMTLQELVRQAASAHLDRTAVCFDECDSRPPVCYTYKTVLLAASELAKFLLSHCDFQGLPEVGLYCQPGVNLPSWILGILQVPAAYVPIDPDSPPSFSAYFMKACNLKYILVEKKEINKFTSSYATVLSYDTVSVGRMDLALFRLHWENVEVNWLLSAREEKPEHESRRNTLSCEISSNNKEHMDVRQEHCLAYVLHTSGTTGTPKVVRVPHACILPNVQHFRELFDITEEDVLFLASPLTFDPSVVEIFVALSSGACLLIVPTSVKVLPSKLAAVLFSHHRVTVLQATPTLLRRFGSQLIKSTILSANTSLRVLALGGEAFPSLTVLRSWRAEGNKTQIFNIYGVTEVSSWATFYRIPEEILNSTLKCELPVQLGLPLRETVVEVRDADGFAIQEGTGQLFLGGKNRVCFLGNEMTVPLGTMRATGDLVTVKDGEIFFLGRKDSQIKRHGKRLNIKLVQQVAEELQQVESCAVTWYNHEALILFIVPRDGLVKDCIFKELQKHLPNHAIPDEIVLIDSLPFTSHGKIDISELNKIYLDYQNSKPENKLHGKEELWGKLQYLWKSVLSLSEDTLKVPEESLFLNSGGDSFKATWLFNEIEKLVGTSIPGLLEAILSSSILEVYNHVIATMSTDEDLTFTKSHATKRKLIDVDQDKASGQCSQEKFTVSINDTGEVRASIALSRGSQVSSVNVGHCPSASSFDFTSQTNTQTLESLTLPALPGQSQDPSQVTAVYEEGMALRVRWRSDTGKCVDASPLLLVSAVDTPPTTVYVGSHSHRVKAIDLSSGKTKWEQVLGDRIESSACISKCGNFIVVGCYDGLVYVLRSNTGEKYWMFTTEDTVKSSPTMDPIMGLLYVGSHDQHAYALDIYATGNIAWKHSCGKPLFSSPQCCQRYVCVGCVDGSLLCFSHLGEQVWQFATGGPIFSSPCISASEQAIFFGSHDCFIYCCSMEGHLQWKFETTSRVYATPFAFRRHGHRNETLLAAASTDGKLWILESQTGQLRSVYELPGEVFSSPVVWDSVLIIGCRNNYIYCLDLLDGNQNSDV